MTQDTTTTLLIFSVLGTMRVNVVLLVGFLASKWPRREPLLNKEACRCISQICAQLFLPALAISSTGATLNPAALRDSWQLVVAGGFTIALSVYLSGAVGRLLLQPEDRRAFRPVQLAVAFHNCIGFPLLLMESLCEQDAVKRDFGDDAAQCFTQVTGMVFTYFVVSQLSFYGWGFYAIADDNTLELKLTGEAVYSRPSIEAVQLPSSNLCHGMAQTKGSPRMDTAHRAAGAGVADVHVKNTVITPLSARASDHVANGIDTAHGDGAHGTEARHMEVGVAGGLPYLHERTGLLPPAPEAEQGGVVHTFKRFATRHWRAEREINKVTSDAVGDGPSENSWASVQHRISVVLMSPNIVSVMIGIVIAMVFPLQQQLFHNPQAVLRSLGGAIETLGTPTVAVITLVMAGSLAQMPAVVAAGGKLERGGDEVLWDMRRFYFIAGALHILCRLILVPAAGFAVFWVARTYTTVLGDNRLMHLIMLIELAMPSAPLVIVSLNQLAMPASAGFLARLYLSQYGASMFTITLWTVLAVRMVY